MKTNKLLITCLLLVLSSSLYAVERSANMRSYLKAMKKLEKKTLSAIDNCAGEITCIVDKYSVYEEKREQIIKYKLHIKLKAFKRLAKTTLKNEAKCIENTPANANMCFENADIEITETVNSLT